MKKYKLIYNPFAGDGTFKNHLDEVIEILQDHDIEVHTFRVMHFGDIEKHISTMDRDLYDAVLISGGDGSINLCVNAMKKHNVNLPLGVFPSGTANDFASFIGLPKSPKEAAEYIGEGIRVGIDIGKANDNYFINVACVGLFASISQSVDVELKNNLGKFAYYLKGAEAIKNIQPMPVKIITSDDEIYADAILILIMNSAGAGGFKNLAPNSDLADGKFDLVLYKSKGKITKDLRPFLQSVKGNHVEDENVIYIQDSYFKIETTDESYTSTETDIDGEQGPYLPLEIQVLKRDLELFIPSNCNLSDRKKKKIHLFKD